MNIDKFLNIYKTENSIDVSYKCDISNMTCTLVRSNHKKVRSDNQNDIITTNTASWHYLLSNSSYNIGVTINGIDTCVTIHTDPIQPPIDKMFFVENQFFEDSPERFYISSRHRMGKWIAQNKSNFLWAQCRNFEFICNVLRHGMFFNYMSREPYVILLNPVSRYCILLNKSVNWFNSKKSLKQSKGVRIAINTRMSEDLYMAQKYHTNIHHSTWLDDKTVSFLLRMHEEEVFNIYCFELWIKKDNAYYDLPYEPPTVTDSAGEEWMLGACTFGYAIGRILHDFTACTLVRDRRSLGSLVTRAAGHVLCQAGFICWYWGFKLKYMKEYDKYGGQLMGREDFYEMLCGELNHKSLLNDVHKALTSCPVKHLEMAVG
eukprot:GHVL01008757.1.p1 GENE.GHVL01008757.1~~GHVL01008757.1.p1  ORF type:complete len:375 (+),score=45.39 GHVL01008757.1:23-1147(+)